ncbi:MAG: YdcF family protein [Proteobacteria bacterium]|nr:YdcF family protein [Pseudomonadota bacterium]
MLIVKRILQQKVLWPVLALVLVLIWFLAELDRVQSESITSWEKDPEADCAVVLTGGANRVREGVDLLAKRQIKKLIISGVHQDSQLREIIPTWSYHPFLREEDVILDRRSGTTYGNAQQSLPFVEALRCRKVLVITSELHMHRAYLTFKSSFPDYIQLTKHTVNNSRSEAGVIELWTEVLKSMFYSLWAY